jgi:uncharacterized membrane-anchored protein YhcB (DUF1043 family)
MNRGSATWLIIFLCAIVFVLGWVILNAQHQQAVNSLNLEIKDLRQQLEQTKTTISSPFPIPSATISAEPKNSASPSANVKAQTATKSGEKK